MNITSHVVSFQKTLACSFDSTVPTYTNCYTAMCTDCQSDQICVHSQLLTKSKFDGVPLLTNMLKFSRFKPFIQMLDKTNVYCITAKKSIPHHTHIMHDVEHTINKDALSK